MFVVSFKLDKEVKKLPLQVMPSIVTIRGIVESMFNIHPDFPYKLKYVDEEGDYLFIQNTLDLDTALQIVKAKEHRNIHLPLIISLYEELEQEEKKIESVSTILGHLDTQINNILNSMNQYLTEKEIEQRLNNVVQNCSSKLSKFSSNAQQTLNSIKDSVQLESYNMEDRLVRFKNKISNLPQMIQLPTSQAREERDLKAKEPVLSLSQIFMKVKPKVSKDEVSENVAYPREKFENDFKLLEDMGFVDFGRNIDLLEKHQGDIVKVVSELTGNI